MDDKRDELLRRPPAAVNIGVRDFAESIRMQGGDVVEVIWSPPAGGDPELMELLDQIL